MRNSLFLLIFVFGLQSLQCVVVTDHRVGIKCALHQDTFWKVYSIFVLRCPDRSCGYVISYNDDCERGRAGVALRVRQTCGVDVEEKTDRGGFVVLHWADFARWPAAATGAISLDIVKNPTRPARDAASPVSMVTKAIALINGCWNGKHWHRRRWGSHSLTYCLKK